MKSVAQFSEFNEQDQEVICERLSHLLSLDKDEMKQHFWDKDEVDEGGNKYGTFDAYCKQIKAWALQVVKGKIQSASYTHASGQKGGRMYVKGFGLQSLQTKVKSFLLDGLDYYDYDMKNAHPTILLHLCKEHKLQCGALQNYVEHKEQALKENSINKFDILISLYQDKPSTRGKSSWFKCFLTEIAKIKAEINKRLGHLVGKTSNKKNPASSTLSSILGYYENEILQKVVDTIGKDKVSHLMFDGFIAKEQLDLELFNELSKEYGIVWTHKSFEDMDWYDYELKEPMIVAETDKEAASIVREHYVNELKSSNGTLYLKNKLKWVPNPRDTQIKQRISALDIHRPVCGDIVPYSHNASGVRNIYDKLRDTMEDYDEENFEQKMHESTLGKLCFKDGVYDARTGQFSTWEDNHEVYTSILMPDKYEDIMQSTDEDVAKVKQLVFENVLLVPNDLQSQELVEYQIQRYSRMIFGEIQDKRWMMNVGARSSGKGFQKEWFLNSFGDYIGTLNTSQLFPKDVSADSDKALYWLMDLRSKRIMWGDEVEVDDKKKMSAKTIKSIVSGGDVQTGRQNYDKSTTKFQLQGSIIINCNDTPEFTEEDANKNRDLVEFAYQFADKNYIGNHPEESRLKLADPNAKILPKDENLRRAFAKLIIDAYSKEGPPPPQWQNELYEDLSTSDNTGNNKYLELFKFNVEGFISNTDLKQIAGSRHNLKMKPQPFKRVLKSLGATDHRTAGTRGLANLEYQYELDVNGDWVKKQPNAQIECLITDSDDDLISH